MNDITFKPLGQFGIKLDKNLFFDRTAIKEAIEKSDKKTLGKIGFLLRRSARQSMRSRKKKAAPGQPPSAHSGKAYPLGPLLKNRLFYYYDLVSESVVVGPEKLGKSDAPEVQEFGTPTKRWVRVRGVKPKKRKPSTELQKLTFKRLVEEGRIPKEEIQLKQITVNVHEHPFMAPALDRESPKFAALYKDQVKSR
jgi:hypothetical protein